MEFFKKVTEFDFVGRKLYAMSISAVLIVASLVYVALNGINYGIDFKGGTLVELRFNQEVEIGEVREALQSGGFGDAEIKYFGSNSEVLVSTEASSAELEGMETSVREALSAKYAADSYTIERVEMVGPKVGGELRRKGIWAVGLSWGLMLIYIAFRFEMKFAVGAIVALIHDVIISVGIYTITGHKFNMPILAAVLTIIGYSVNDTIVVFDRIRENLRKTAKTGLEDLVNLSINQTLGRTILTSLATLISVVALYIFGAEAIRDFAFILIVGLVVGTYSSIYVASPVLLFWKRKTVHLK